MFGKTIFDELNDFRRTFDRVFDDYYTSNRRATGGDRSEYAFAPAVESGWTDDFLNLRVILPGVSEKDVKLTVQGGNLSIQGERRAPDGFGKEGMIYSQLPYGKFERVLELPSGLDLDHLQAHLHDGLLDIRVPVAQAVKPKQVPISVGAAQQEKKTIAA